MPVVQYKSPLFVAALCVVCVLTIATKLSTFVVTFNPLSLVTPVFATVTGVFLVRKDHRIIACIRAWAVVEIVAVVLFVAGSGCEALLAEDLPVSPKALLAQVLAGIIVFSVASAGYFLTPRYIVIDPVHGGSAPSGSPADAVWTEEMRRGLELPNNPDR